MIKEKRNIWREVRDFFREQKKNKIVTRKQLLEHCLYDSYKNVTVVDTYRSYLVRAGYLATNKNGKYKRIQTIPKNLSLRQIRFEGKRNIHVYFELPAK